MIEQQQEIDKTERRRREAEKSRQYLLDRLSVLDSRSAKQSASSGEPTHHHSKHSIATGAYRTTSGAHWKQRGKVYQAFPTLLKNLTKPCRSFTGIIGKKRDENEEENAPSNKKNHV